MRARRLCSDSSSSSSNSSRHQALHQDTPTREQAGAGEWDYGTATETDTYLPYLAAAAAAHKGTAGHEQVAVRC
jgi:hypothetical protein